METALLAVEYNCIYLVCTGNKGLCRTAEEAVRSMDSGDT